jgi:hydrogenase/urease accessory protein HupE
MSAPFALLAVWWGLLLPAHQVGLSRGVYTLVDNDVVAELQLASGDVRAIAPGTPMLDAPPGTALSPASLQPFGDAVVVTVDGRLCPGGIEAARVVDRDGVEVAMRMRCDAAGRIEVDARWLLRLPPGHRHVASVGAAAERRDVLLHGEASTLTITGPATPTRVGFVALGVEHILLGIDHLVFLLALVVVGGRWRDRIAIVTAFTVAHSVTLALAVLGVVAPAAGWVEPAIALSIVVVGVENFFVVDLRGRWRRAGIFGFIHGFGFAGALAEVGLPTDDVPTRLLAFNVGVELGQLVFLVVLLVPLEALRRGGWFGVRAVRVVSVAVVLLGAGWFVARIAGE